MVITWMDIRSSKCMINGWWIVVIWWQSFHQANGMCLFSDNRIQSKSPLPWLYSSHSISWRIFFAKCGITVIKEFCSFLASKMYLLYQTVVSNRKQSADFSRVLNRVLRQYWFFLDKGCKIKLMSFVIIKFGFVLIKISNYFWHA